MDVPEYRIVFRKTSESYLHFYERCEKIKADEKLTDYVIYSPKYRSIRIAESVNDCVRCGYGYMILMKGPRAKSDKFFKSGEYEKHAAEFVEKVKAMDPICVSCTGVYCEDGVYYREEAALYYCSNAMESRHDFQMYWSHKGMKFAHWNLEMALMARGLSDVMVNVAHMDSAHWVKYLPDDPDDSFYVASCCPRIRVWFPEYELHGIDRDRWFLYMASEIRKMKETEKRLSKKSSLDKIRSNIARIYDKFSDSEKLMVELDMA